MFKSVVNLQILTLFVISQREHLYHVIRSFSWILSLYSWNTPLLYSKLQWLWSHFSWTTAYWDQSPLYSSNFLNYFFFPKVKIILLGKRYPDIEDIKKNITTELKAVPSDAFVNYLEKHLELYSKNMGCGI